MKYLINILAAVLLSGFSAMAPVYAAEVAQGKGTVVKVDAAAGVVNLRHEPIAVLKWPAMAMDFKVTDHKLLAGLKPGQAVVFGLVKDPATGYAIARIEVAK